MSEIQTPPNAPARCRITRIARIARRQAPLLPHSRGKRPFEDETEDEEG
jgi:hypothetical protein